MKYFVMPDETLQLDAHARESLRGDFAELSDGYTHYELRGPDTGELAVLVPGLTIPLFYWDGVAPKLHARGIRTLAFSAYGRGYSDRAQGRYDEAMFVRQLRELLAFLGIGTPVNLVGTSMGALGAMAYLLDRPETVRTLTLIGPAGLSTDTALQQRALKANPIASFAARRFGRKILLGHLGRNVSDPALVEPLTAMISDCYRFEGSMYCFFSTLQNYPISGREDLYRRTGGLGIPTLLAWGTEDQVTPISGFDRARDLVRPTRTEIIEDCGHMAPYERPAHTADLLSSFITARHDRIHS
ncbi:alpha/beta fold hydrolase [Streptomyces sp. SLBN-8D4]|jgi:pimeloyl-ACP methyl ester carboxylesterase|uniref:alpha/beta fold hydrolase n=1 Tax=Streptomyces sp. SLBN-8D4 TaxID=3377728 RepID=UPI003C7D4723